MPTQTVVRELEEELELEISEKELRKVFVIKFLGKKYYIFRANLKRGLKELKLHKGKEMKLFSREEVLFNRDILFTMKVFFMFYFIFNR